MRGRSRRVPLVESRTSVDTHRLAGVALAVFERARGIVAWHVPTTAHDIVDVLAQSRSLGTILTSAEAEYGCGHEVRPLMQLLRLPIVERAREDQAADGITIASGTMRIKLPTSIAGGDIQGCQVTDARYLDVIGGLDEVSAFDGARWDDTSSVSGLYAPRDLDLLCVANDRIWTRLGRSEEAKVVHGVYIQVLARRRLVAPGSTIVRARLTILGVIGKTVWRVCRGVRLAVDGQDSRERDQSKETKTKS